MSITIKYNRIEMLKCLFFSPVFFDKCKQIINKKCVHRTQMLPLLLCHKNIRIYRTDSWMDLARRGHLMGVSFVIL